MNPNLIREQYHKGLYASTSACVIRAPLFFFSASIKRTLNQIYICVAFALIFNPVVTNGQTTVVNTVPEEIESYNIPSGPTTYIALTLVSDSSSVGIVSAVAANTISVATNPAPWTAGELATAAAPYFVKFLTGSETGRVILITANTTNTLTLDTTDNTTQTVTLTTSGFSVQVGDSFEVFPGDTLASLFGNNTQQNPLLFTGSSSAFTADTISIWSKTLTKFQAYFFNTTYNYWVLNGSTANANNTILYPYMGLSILRRTGQSAITFALAGRAAEVPILTKTPGIGIVTYTSTDYAVNMTLSQLKYGPNWVKNTGPFTADTISIYNNLTLKFDAYYQLPDSTWRKSGDTTTDQSGLVIPAGTSLSILQRSTVSGATSYLSSVIPYSLN